MSDIGIVTSSNDNDLFEIEVGLMLSEALKEAGTVLVSQKGKKALLGDGKKDATLAQRISGGGAEKTLEVTIGTRASKGPVAGQIVKAAKRPEHVGRKSGSAKVLPDGRMVKQGTELNAKTLASLNSDFERIIDTAAQKAIA